MAVGDAGEERPEDGPHRAGQLLDQPGLLGDAHHPQPERHHADQPDRQRHALADGLHVAAHRAGNGRGHQQEHEDEVHASINSAAARFAKVSAP